MKWITRKNVEVDRVACPWLIRRFIDPAAEFLSLRRMNSSSEQITKGQYLSMRPASTR